MVPDERVLHVLHRCIVERLDTVLLGAGCKFQELRVQVILRYSTASVYTAWQLATCLPMGPKYCRNTRFI